MGFFSSKKDSPPPPIPKLEEEDQVDNLNTDSNTDNTPSSPRAEPKENIKLNSLIAGVEKLKAQAEANAELRQIFSEKFTRIDEEIGELRTMLIDREKEMKNLEITATKAADLVGEVQPEKLMIEVKRMDAKVEALKGKLESHEQINDTLMEELKEVRNNIRTFRGVKEIEKMTKDLLEDQTVLRKIEATVEQHSDKVESMFMEMNKRYEEIKRLKDMAENLSTSFSKVNAEVGDFKIKFQNLASKDEFNKFKTDINAVITPLRDDEEALDKMVTELKSLQKDVLPLVKKYQAMNEEQNIAKKDYENFKIGIHQKVDDRIKNYEQIIVRLERQNEAVMKQNDAFLHKFDGEIDRLKDIKQMMNMKGANLEGTDVMLQRVQSLENDNQQLQDAIRRMGLLFKRVLEKQKENMLIN